MHLVRYLAADTHIQLPKDRMLTTTPLLYGIYPPSYYYPPILFRVLLPLANWPYPSWMCHPTLMLSSPLPTLRLKIPSSSVTISIPRTSSLANVLGKAFAGKSWLAASPLNEPSYADATEGDKQGVVEKERRKVLAEMRAAIGRGQPEGADAVFFAWDASQNASSASSSLYSYKFVRDVLNTMLQSKQTGKANANVGYLSKVVWHLLERGVVSRLMVGDVDYGNLTTMGDASGRSDGNGASGNDLLEMLRRRGDWPSISLALKTIKDLQEVDVVACLCFVLARHRQSQNPNELSDTTQVDSPPEVLDSWMGQSKRMWMAKVLKEARDAKEGKEVKEALDWRQRRRMLQEQAGVIGQYQLEELAF
ncbi:hypothetical protein BDP27DRAFT_1371337 [Rhodocollybia butyracea]|uniref:Uncharacterized protein n=1 Tax=Rhodocollybia butyracea TaxID=206335 RepID=A0A9P5P662_9AGAR|nr:hypothetical protein BDP27DRAFT_1371337 [Rhodocollybia butyracea]